MKAEWTNVDSLSCEETTKAILVLNKMPKSCDECDYCGFYTSCSGEPMEERSCLLADSSFIGIPKKDERDVICPLKPIPTYDWHEEGKENECEEWYKNGWNDCIDAINSDTDGTKGEK